MGRDHQPKDRQLKRQTKKENARAPYPRLLIVTEGQKSEPAYLRAICKVKRLQSANVRVLPSAARRQHKSLNMRSRFSSVAIAP
jgi:hypothetical protein